MEKKQTHIMYGFVSGIAMAVVGLIVYLAGIAFKPGMQYISFIPFLVGIVLNAMAYSKANDTYVTFGNVFGSCFKATMVAALVTVAWAIITIFVFPEMKDKAINMTHDEMSKNPKMTDEMIDAALNITRKYWNVLVISAAIFGTLFYGAIFSLIGGAVAKKSGERPITSGNTF